MIQKVTVKGFQRHQHLVLELDPHVTTIVGSSDQGKSACLRAIRWVALNKPRSSEFINWDAKRASVTIRVDGHKITRAKGVEENTYILDGKHLDAFGNDVPRDVADILQVADENYQDQHDAPFWLSLSPPEVSRRLNDVVDLSVIDTTLSNLSSALRKTSTEREVVQERLENAITERRGLKYAKEANDDLQQVERLAAKQATEAQHLATIEEMVTKATTLRDARQRARDVSREGSGVVALGEVWEKLNLDEETISNLINEMQKLQSIAFTEIPDIEPLEEAAERSLDLSTQYSTIDGFLQNAVKMQEAIKFFKDAFREASDTLKDEMGAVCILCGSALR